MEERVVSQLCSESLVYMLLLHSRIKRKPAARKQILQAPLLPLLPPETETRRAIERNKTITVDPLNLAELIFGVSDLKALLAI